MKRNSISVRKRSFTGIDVTPCHFVTAGPDCGEAASSPAYSDRREPVTRRFQPAPAALEQLIEVLYQLLVDVPAESTSTPCVSLPNE
jgi:hypothetical protein